MSHLRIVSAPRLPILLQIVAAFTLLTACGGGGESKSADTGDSAAATPVSAAGAAADKGAATYAQICASCHQANGEGVESTFPPLKHSSWVTGAPEVPIAIVLAGLQGDIEVDGKKYAGAMQAWSMLGDEDVANVLTYARSQWGNSAGPVTAAQVKAVRDKIGSRTAWTVAELKAAYPGAGS